MEVVLVSEVEVSLVVVGSVFVVFSLVVDSLVGLGGLCEVGRGLGWLVGPGPGPAAGGILMLLGSESPWSPPPPLWEASAVLCAWDKEAMKELKPSRSEAGAAVVETVVLVLTSKEQLPVDVDPVEVLSVDV